MDVRLFQDGSAIDMQWQSPPENVACMTERTRRALLKLKGVKDAAIYRIRTYSESVYYKNTSFSGKMTGIDESYFGVKGYNIVRAEELPKQTMRPSGKLQYWIPAPPIPVSGGGADRTDD